MVNEEAAAKGLEAQVKSLKEELEICKQAKTTSEACKAISEYAQQKEEPFTTSHAEPNVWHKSAGGGGGCYIL
jgi:hypothetical protein